MQSPLQSPTKLAGRIDRFGLCLITLLGCFGWFYFLWGRVYPALAAGISLSVLILSTVRLGENRTLDRREAAIRRRIGGEMAVESLLLQSPASAVNNVVGWMTQAVALSDFTPMEDGILARNETNRVWISCLQHHASSPTGCDEVLLCVRRARQEEADICIVVSTSDFTQQAVAMAEELAPRTRLLGRSGLTHMAGRAAPATDEQLRALGKRRRQKFRRELWQARVLDPSKKRRYVLYGLGLTTMYLLTRQLVYLIPALVCYTLFALCRRKPKGKFTI